jgi:hypothetical protein
MPCSELTILHALAAPEFRWSVAVEDFDVATVRVESSDRELVEHWCFEQLCVHPDVRAVSVLKSEVVNLSWVSVQFRYGPGWIQILHAVLGRERYDRG